MMPGYWSLLLLLQVCLQAVLAEDYYQLLGVSRQATDREIRKAFKKLAIKMHPDKNTNDPGAHDKFLKINRAYEVLKDAELRKKYDTHGEEGLKDGPSGGGYKSWNYYNQDFGIYDDDPEIVTLNQADFETSVDHSGEVWFINYYSPHCGHCHELAPTWRELARDMEGVLRFGAVNCEDDWMLCRQQQIHSYPSLILYPGRIKYHGERTMREFKRFVLQHVKAPVHELWGGNFDSLVTSEDKAGKPWLITFCGAGGDCLEKSTCTKLAAMLFGLTNVGLVDCHQGEELCDKLGHTAGTFFFDVDNIRKGRGMEITTLDAKEIKYTVLAQLPDVTVLSRDKFKALRADLVSGRELPWLVHFVDGDYEDLDLRTLPALLQDTTNFGRVDCQALQQECASLHVIKRPAFAVFKPGGGFELHHGRQLPSDLAAFAREVGQTKVTVLSPDDFPQRVIDRKDPWFVDFYAPWCPPCMRLLPEFRKASRAAAAINFGTVDCTIHGQLCQQYNIRSYPTTIFYNNSVPHVFHGHHSEADLVEFIQDTLDPPVTVLNSESYEQHVTNKPAKELWLVDYYAPWCGPCQQLAPEWRRLAKMFGDVEEVHVANVDCQKHQELCRQQGVNSYPSIRLYPAGQVGGRNFQAYTGWHRDAQSLHAWAFEFLPSPVEVLTGQSFQSRVLHSRDPWVVDFYAPWCGHCQVFAPQFARIAKAMEAHGVKAGKVNCEQNNWLCQQTSIRHFPTVRFYEGTSQHDRAQGTFGEEIGSLEPDYILKFLKDKTRHKQHDEL